MSQFKVLVTDKLSSKGLEILGESKNIVVDVQTEWTKEQIIENIGRYDGLLVRSGTQVVKEIIDAADSLKVIGRAGVGVDNIDLEAASKRGIVVMNAPSGNTLSTTELTISMLLALSRQIPQAHMSMQAKRWDRKKFMGTEVYGKVLGIIGFGRIGKEVAKRMKSFGMKVLAYDPYATEESAKVVGAAMASLDEIYAEADFITVHVPLTEETKGLINKDTLAKMKKGVALINCARGGIINEQALCDAIKSGQVAGAAFDVYETEPPAENCPLYDCEQVIMTPHLGASTVEAQENVAIDVARQVVDMLEHGQITNAVNFTQVMPEVYEKTKAYVVLAEKMGLLLASLSKGRHKTIDVKYNGELSMHATSHLTVALLKGFLGAFMPETVNDVNAPYMAKERGIGVNEEKSQDSEDFASIIRATVTTEDGESISVAGTTFGKNDMRIVRIDDYYVDLAPNGPMLICQNVDKPGFIGEIGTLLGANQINIANLSLGRKAKGTTAITALNLDSPLSDEMLKKLLKIPNIIKAVAVTF